MADRVQARPRAARGGPVARAGDGGRAVGAALPPRGGLPPRGRGTKAAPLGWGLGLVSKMLMLAKF